jgi:hypothetical protein
LCPGLNCVQSSQEFHCIVSFDYNRLRQCKITVCHFRFHMVSIYNDKCWGYWKKYHQYQLSASRQGFCKTNILYGTRGHVENPEIKKKFEILQQKKNLTRQDFFGSVAFGQTNYIFILAPEVQKKIFGSVLFFGSAAFGQTNIFLIVALWYNISTIRWLNKTF